MSTATKGRAAEHAIRHMMEELGWLVIRSAGSKGHFDLVCLFADDARFPTSGVVQFPCRWVGVSVKSGTARDSPKDRKEKSEVAKKHGGQCLFVRRRSGRLKDGESRWIMEWGE